MSSKEGLEQQAIKPHLPGPRVFPGSVSRLCTGLAQLPATSGESQAIEPHTAASPSPPEKLGTGCVASFTCTVMMYIIWLLFHYLIFKKPILLVFYMKNILQK